MYVEVTWDGIVMICAYFFTIAVFLAGENRCTRDGEQGATVEQRSGRPYEEAHGKGMLTHTHTYVASSMSSMVCTHHLRM